jgi:hypothetical protein
VGSPYLSPLKKAHIIINLALSFIPDIIEIIRYRREKKNGIKGSIQVKDGRAAERMEYPQLKLNASGRSTHSG